VLEVMDDTPARKAGLRAGDVIRQVDGNRVGSPEELVRAIARTDEGKSVKLSVRRKKRDLTITATPEAPDRDDRSGIGPGAPGMMRLGPGGPGWMRDDDDDAGPSGHRSEIDALRDEVRKLREEIEGMKNQR